MKKYPRKKLTIEEVKEYWLSRAELSAIELSKAIKEEDTLAIDYWFKAQICAHKILTAIKEGKYPL